uniref:Uncharacterized protein n=1 Tax=Odontella aurita TaxID=265563 RepID=A0A7S4M8E9_9STRA|mmetsp:Transcript_14028/g.41079  ORF Transcript_14028/g.41079 Transcript_14028/m.41079 type:complete len:722 (+) Transcript_14028:1997-4162(+)
MMSSFLDQIFKYQSLGNIADPDNEEINTTETHSLNGNLKEFLAKAYFNDQGIDILIKYYEDRDDCSFCKSVVEDYLKPLRDKFFNLGFDRSSLDTSIALIFGNKTTIGQVCSYARGLEDNTVDDLPGFCCLDAPYQVEPEWGKKYSCEKYFTLADQSTKVVQKGPEECKRLGPITSGFNEAACDIFHGTWCPTPRSCADLVNCIEGAKEEVEISRDRQAFLEYLDEAPKVESPYDDPKECGDLREYFEYDRDYPDDDRICQEVLDLQCFTDFSNLDGFATGTAGPGSDAGLDELAVSDKVKLITKKPFHATTAKAWKILNAGLEAAIEIYEYAQSVSSGAAVLCTISISCVPGSSAPCTVPAQTVKFSFDLLVKITKQVVSISKKIFDVVVDGQNFRFAGDRQKAIYENVITNHGNIITTFHATQQLKVMLGEISDGIAELAEEEEEQRRRMMENGCKSTADGYTNPCDKVSCEDPTRFCDGSFNFEYVAFLRGAGCDELDSDGDGLYDVCEDRFRPEIVVREAKLFRCDKDNTTRLCHDETIFNEELLALSFLRYEFAATDDCQATDKLSVDIDYVEGSCRNTKYRLTPVQNVPECHNVTNVGPFKIPFTNPLSGVSKEVYVVLDEEAPFVECGFRSDKTSINEISDDGKTLYHYMLKTHGNGFKLTDADFWYHVTVSEECTHRPIQTCCVHHVLYLCCLTFNMPNLRTIVMMMLVLRLL